MWGLQKYQNHYEILFGRGCIDLENSAILLLLAQGKSAPFSFFEDCNMTKYLTNIFLIWINVNRLCSHVGLEFWTSNSFMYPKLTIFTTWKFRFTTLYTSPLSDLFCVCANRLMCTNKYLLRWCYFQVLILQKVTTAFFIAVKKKSENDGNLVTGVSKPLCKCSTM